MNPAVSRWFSHASIGVTAGSWSRNSSSTTKKLSTSHSAPGVIHRSSRDPLRGREARRVLLEPFDAEQVRANRIFERRQRPEEQREWNAHRDGISRRARAPGIARNDYEAATLVISPKAWRPAILATARPHPRRTHSFKRLGDG
jgi:hypothetical protein